MKTALLVDVVRSPMGRGKPAGDGQFTGLHPVELLRQTLKGLLGRHDFDPGLVDDLMIGCVSQVSEQGNMPGRMAWLGAGLPAHVPSTMIDRKCGSSQQAIHFAAQSIMAGANDIVIAGGVESMSRVPMGSARAGADTDGPSIRDRYEPGLIPQGVSAELVAARWSIGREAMDAYAAQSHARAAQARASGGFDAEIVTINRSWDGGSEVALQDESIREGTTAERLSGLKPAFQDEAMKTRFPEIDWSVTAGNSSQITDGAALALVMSEDKAKELGLTPRARFVGFDVCGADPIEMLSAPIPATRRILAKSGIKLGDIDQYEVNEAFASIPLAWAKEFDADAARLNPHGGAIALGHPLGASGARLMATLLNGLERAGGRYGLQTMCEAGGMANATIIERL